MSKQAQAQPAVKIGDFVRDAIIAKRALDDLTTKEIVAEAKREFPKSKVNEFHVYWYAKQLRAFSQ